MDILETGNGIRFIKKRNFDPQRASFDQIPIIDLEPLLHGSRREKYILAQELRKVCIEIGFFYIKNHHVQKTVLDDAFSVAKEYFSLPVSLKRLNHISLSDNKRGYATMLEENVDPAAYGDLHESYDIALEVPADDPDVKAGKTLYGPNQWPTGIPQFRSALETYHTKMHALSVQLLRAFALALDLQETHFDSMINKPLATLRILHYPPQYGTIDDKQIGIGAHSDYDCFTILAQDKISALHVLNASGEWITAAPIPGCFVVNIGDLMARWTNDLFASTIHRVVNRSGQERYSIPFFFGPNFDVIVKVLPSCLDAKHPAKYSPVTAGEYLKSRYAATYNHTAGVTSSRAPL